MFARPVQPVHPACAALLALALLLPGCALLPGDEAGPPPVGRDPQATAPATPGASSAPPAFDVRVEGDDASLRTLIERHDPLQRYRAASELDDTELARLLALAEREVRNLLGAEGYFSPDVRAWREAGSAGRPTLVIAFRAGPATRTTQVEIDFRGDIAGTSDATAQAQRAAIVSGWSLGEGRRFTQERWADAKTGALRQLVERRYPRGRIAHSQADIDAPAHAARLAVTLDSGPAFRLGPASVTGAQRYPPELAERLSWLKPGDVYDQQRLVEAQQRLTGSGYYDAAYISIDPQGDPEAAPVHYAVTEAKRHKVQLGLGYSTDSGPRLTLEHRDNTAFGTRWRADTRLHLDRKTPLLQAELTDLPGPDGWRWGGLARTMRQDDGTLATLSKTLRVGRLQTGEQYDRNVYLQYDHATVTGSGTSAVPDALLGDGAAISANYAWTGRYFNNRLLPTRGYGLAFDVGAGLTTIGPRKPFARLTGRWLGFVPLGGGASRLALRAEGGAILASTQARLPAIYLFRTGGDATVRGYAFRSIGIPVAGNLVAPGRYLGVASVEWQRPILQQRWPGLLEHTVFVDVGSVANRPGNLRPHWGVGTGLRLITPVGPMELDLAYGLKTRRLRLHINVGFVF